MEPPFLREHLDFLSSLNEVYAGSRQFAAVTVTLESDPSPLPLSPGVPLIPRMRRAVPECWATLKIPILAAFTIPMKNPAFQAWSWVRCRCRR
jgi:hypothetical protein